MSVILEMCVKYSPLFIKASVTTVLLSVVSIAFSMIFGSLMALMKLSKIKPIRWFANVYVEFIRGTPLLVQIYMVFYGLPMIGIDIPSITIGGMDFERLISGIIALTINSTAYMCEIVRGGIVSIDIGQTEAARSIGFSKWQSMRLIVLPQAIKNILPSLGNEFVSLIKNSSQVSVIGVAELMYTSDTIRSISFKPFEPLVIVSVIYFIMTSIISFFVRVIEKKLAVSSKR
ncbi:MAG: amino acid ABC transporter permease [Oscillospiraceae bacterium]